MLNRKFYPFERNNYYFGKLLTAKDFESEQKYMNDKRRFMNRLVNSFGIVSGLDVVPADDTSIVLQAGCALDAGGREIVVPETQVIKLSTVEGYSDLETGTAYLGIKYDEVQSDEVYAVISNDSATDTKFNKSKEGFKLFLADELMVNKVASPVEEFVSETVIYQDDAFSVTQYTPKYVTEKGNINIKVVIKKLIKNKAVCSLFYNIEASGFDTADGVTPIAISANNVQLLQNETYEMTVTLKPQSYIFGTSSALLDITNISFQKGTEEFSINKQLQVSMKPVRGDLIGYLTTNYYKKAMDKTIDEDYEEKLWLAKLNIIKSAKQFIIDGIETVPFKQYVYNTEQLMLLNKLHEFYPDSITAAVAGKTEKTSKKSAAVEKYDLSKYTSSGIQEIPIGLGYELRQPVFSDEIMHGLGKGPVYIDLGIEYITSSGDVKSESNEILLGDSSMFAKYDATEKEEKLYNITTAVKILPDRGTFIIGVCPYETTDVISVRIRWYAFRVAEMNKQFKNKNDGAKCILLNPDTIVLPPKGTAHITPVFVNMEAETCAYKLIDVEGGSIDNNGIYTAPAKEGVYEIRVECISDPTIFVHAFAVVSQKKAGEQTKAKKDEEIKPVDISTDEEEQPQ